MADSGNGVTVGGLAQLRDASLGCLDNFDAWLQKVSMLGAHVDSGDLAPTDWLDRIRDGANNLRDVVDQWRAIFNQGIKNWLVRANVDSIAIPEALDDRFATACEIAFVAANRALEILIPFDVYPISKELILAARKEAKGLRQAIVKLHLEPLIREEWARAQNLLDDYNAAAKQSQEIYRHIPSSPPSAAVQDDTTRLAGTQIAAKNSGEPVLAERDRIVLGAMLEKRAFDSDHLIKTQIIAELAAGKGTDGGSFKEVIVKLKSYRYVETREGRSGGVWLTPDGKMRAESINR